MVDSIYRYIVLCLGDVRRLLGWAKSAMQLAWTTHKGGNAAGISMLITQYIVM